MIKKSYVLNEEALKAVLQVSLELPEGIMVAYNRIPDTDDAWAVQVKALPEIIDVIGAEFRKLGKQTCPFCSSKSATIGAVNTEGKEEPVTYLVRSVQCNECHKVWDEFFSLDFIYYLSA